jgi:hypothetical protein
MQNRTEKRFNSLDLPQGFRFGFYSDIGTLQTELGENFAEKLLCIVNKQLAAHVTASWSRDQFTTDLERVSGFAYKTKEKVTKAGSTVNVANETPAEYVNRFREACKGGLTLTPAHDLGKIVGKEEDNDNETSIANELRALVDSGTGTEEASINAWLQKLADLRVYPLDARVAEHTAKEKSLPKYAVEGAAVIYAGNEAKGRDSEANWAHWSKTFAKNQVVLPTRTGDSVVDLKVLATAIVANEAAEAKTKYK